jgi:cytochrome P450
LCRDLLERLGDDSEGDGAIDYAQKIPTRLTARMLGISEHAGKQFRKWIYEFFELGAADSTIVQDVIAEIMAFFDGEIAKRRASPGDDLISYLLDARIDGKPIDQIDINGALRLLLFAGIDTTWRCTSPPTPTTANAWSTTRN